MVHGDPLSVQDVQDTGTSNLDRGRHSEDYNADIIPSQIHEIEKIEVGEGIVREPSLSVQEANKKEKIKISVSDPIKQISDHTYLPGLTSSHYEYLITSVYSDSALSAEYRQVEVRRRFSDFMALADILDENQRGYFIFPRPSKGNFDAATSGRTEMEFIEFRRADLERYLSKLSEHPIISQVEEFKVFLTAQGSLCSSFEWQQLQPLHQSLLEGFARLPKQLMGAESMVPTVQDITKNARSTNDVLRILKEMGEKMKQGMSNSSQELPEDEVHLRKLRTDMENYCDHLVQVSRKSERLISEFERLGSVTGDVGLSLIRLAKYEDEYGGPTGQYSSFASETQKMAVHLRRVGMYVVKLSRQERTCTENLVLSLLSIHNQLAMAQSAIDAFKEREWAFLTVMNTKDTLAKNVDSLGALEKAQAATTIEDSSAMKKIESMKNDIAGLEVVLHAAEVGYKEIRRRNMVDYERWIEEQVRDTKVMQHTISESMSSFDLSSAKEWETVARDIEQEFQEGHIH